MDDTTAPDPAPTRLLLVEDNPGDAYLVMEMLDSMPEAGFTVTAVARCAEAEQRLRLADVDAILLDLSLPDARGLAGLIRLRAAAPDVPIVIMSGNADEAMAIAGVRAGAQDYLIKGQADGTLLVRAVRYALERRRAEMQLAQARSAELALRESNRRMEEFISIAGHELRTPLTSVLGNLELAGNWVEDLRHGAAPQDAGREEDIRVRLERVVVLLHRAQQQGTRLSRLVGDLLDASHIEAGRLTLRSAPHDLAALVRDVVDEYGQRLARRTMQLDPPSPEVVPVYADGDRIVQVLTNYLSNALKYSEDDQPVAVGVSVEGAVARVWVRDAGPGLPPSEQARVWERFYRVGGIAHRAGSSVGLGLGLYICRTIVERHGGQAGVESRPGAGATFWFTLPLADPVLLCERRC